MVSKTHLCHIYYVLTFLTILLRRNFVIDIHSKTGQLLNKGSVQQVSGPTAGGYDFSQTVQVSETQSIFLTSNAQFGLEKYLNMEGLRT